MISCSNSSMSQIVVTGKRAFEIITQVQPYIQCYNNCSKCALIGLFLSSIRVQRDKMFYSCKLSSSTFNCLLYVANQKARKAIDNTLILNKIHLSLFMASSWHLFPSFIPNN